MMSQALRAFVRDIAARREFSAADMQFLRQARAESAADPRELVDLFLLIESFPGEKPAGWPQFLIETIVDMVVWGERPTGIVPPDVADWLLARVAPEGHPPKGALRALLVALVREAQMCDPRIAALAFGVERPAPRPAAVATTLGWLDSSGIGV